MKTFSLLSFLLAACTNGAPQTSGNTPEGITREVASANAIDLITDLTPNSGAVCPPAAGARLRCFARARLNKRNQRFTTSSPVSGLQPSDIQTAYALSNADASGTVAIVDAYDDPKAEADLSVFRNRYNLPPCTTQNGCFQKVNQQGQATPLPQAAPAADDWTGETSLDLDAVSSACPGCKIILIEADDDQGDGLYVAQNTAATMGATVVSDSWGGSESADQTANDAAYFQHAGVTTFVASGDNGYGVSYPATSPLVVAVGGTTLTQDSSSRGWTETVWNASGGATGSGCSAYESQPSWQASVNTGCSLRATNDIAAAADPASGLSVYDTANGNGGWMVVGGTSMATPIAAGIFVATGNGAVGPAFSYANTEDFFDVTSGADGKCATSILCNADPGWDGPTGNGTPNGAALTH